MFAKSDARLAGLVEALLTGEPVGGGTGFATALGANCALGAGEPRDAALAVLALLDEAEDRALERAGGAGEAVRARARLLRSALCAESLDGYLQAFRGRQQGWLLHHLREASGSVYAVANTLFLLRKERTPEHADRLVTLAERALHRVGASLHRLAELGRDLPSEPPPRPSQPPPSAEPDLGPVELDGLLDKAGLGAGKRILLLEDDPYQARSVAALLEDRGHAVEWISDGAQLMDRAAVSQPDLVLLDVMVPSVDGFSVAARLKGDARTAAVPLVFLSAYDAIEARVRGLSLGAVDYLAKPFHPAELIARVEGALRAAEQQAILRARADLDELTGIGNYRYFQERLKAEIARAGRYGIAVSLVLVDLDHLKTINDRFGHAEGNATLARLGAILREQARETDVVARFGGDEFAAILPHTSPEAGRFFAERIARRFAARAAGSGEGAVPCTLSVGIAGIDVRAGDPAEDVMRRADAALYASKRGGRARITVAEETVG